MKTKATLLIVAFASICLFSSLALSQTINGSISGRIVDQQGAVVSGASVTVSNPSTGFERTVTTGPNGIYRITGIPVGSYSVKVVSQGFSPKTSDTVMVSVATETELNFDLAPGSVEVSVDVTTTSEMLDTTHSQVSKNVSSKQIMALPGQNTLNGLALLQPGVLPNQNGRPGSGFAVNGNRTRSNNFTIDGSNNNDQSLSIPRQSLPADAIREFQIITNTFSAEYGRQPGSYVNQITNSGTNQYHGSAFWTWAGNGLDALTTGQQRTFNSLVATQGEDRALRSARSVIVDNRFGFSFGGPLPLPSFGDDGGPAFTSGKDRTFFFTTVDFNPVRRTIGSAIRTALSPIGFQRLQYPGRAGMVPAALNYLVTNYPAANVPASQGDITIPSTSSLFLAACPPTDPTSCNVIPFQQYNRFASGGVAYGTDFWRWMAKVDTKINNNDQLSFRYLIDDSNDPGAPTSLPGQEVGSVSRNDSFTINDAYMINSAWLNEARFSFSRRKINFPEDLSVALTVNSTGGAFNVGNSNYPQYRNDTVYEFTENVSYTQSKHAAKFGYNLLIYDLESFFAPNFDGTVTYGDLLAFLTDTNASFQQYAGNGLTDARTLEHGFFVQDNWRPTPDLMLNLGVRYEYVTAPYGFFSNATPDKNNFGPRLGFAWNPKGFIDGRFVLRGGFAIAYDQVFQNILLNNSRNYPRGVNVSFTNISGQLPYINLPQPPDPEDYTGNINLLPYRYFHLNEAVRQPMSRQQSVGMQFQLTDDMVVKIDYIGTMGSNLVREIEENYGFTTAAGGTGLRLDPTRGSVLVGRGMAKSWYHSGQVTFERRFADLRAFDTNFGSMLFNANYTWSKFLSESDDVLGGQANRTLPQDPRCPSCDKGPSGFDQPHRFVVNFVYEVPDLFKDNAWLNRIFAGWMLSGVGTYASGTPFTVFNSNNALGILPGQVSTVEGSQRVSVNPNGTYPLVSTPGAPNPNAYFIVNAANSGIVGSLGANTERTGGTQNWNASVIKNIRTFGESQALQIRFDMFNVFNHRNFTVIPSNTIGNTVNTALFLNLGQTNVGGRTYTFGARYSF